MASVLQEGVGLRLTHTHTHPGKPFMVAAWKAEGGESESPALGMDQSGSNHGSISLGASGLDGHQIPPNRKANSVASWEGPGGGGRQLWEFQACVKQFQ